MLLRYLLGALAALAWTANAQTYCQTIQPPVPPCVDTAPRDLLFLVDGSNSMNRDRFFGEMLDYSLSLYCAFDPAKSNQAGMIVFNEQIKLWIPLSDYTQTQWLNAVETVRASRDQPDSACCSCCTPTAEAFDAANDEFAARGKNAISIAFMITDGVPSNNFADTGGNPAWWYYNPSKGFNPATYSMRIVPDRANVLKQNGHRIFLVGVPNIDNVPPQQAYFSGGLPNNSKQCVKRTNKNFCARYFKPPFPITSVPVDKNSFSTNTWDVQKLIEQTVDALCEILPTQSPTKAPTKVTVTKSPTSPAPTVAPTNVPPLEQVEVTFLIDRSRSMLFHNEVCKRIVEKNISEGLPKPRSYCWELWMHFILDQADELVKVKAGVNKDRDLGWASDFPDAHTPAKGLRVNLVGFACTNHQRTPRVFQYSLDLNGGPITSRENLVQILDALGSAVLPTGGTCPGLSIEHTVKLIEETSAADYPLQTVILLTDGVFYDKDFPKRATTGLEAYKALRFAVGIAVAQDKYKYGLTPKEIQTQRQQLLTFVGKNPELFKNLDTDGWEILPQIAHSIALDLPNYYFQGDPIPRYTWCGWRRLAACSDDDFRLNNCKWPKKKVKEWGCKKKNQNK